MPTSCRGQLTFLLTCTTALLCVKVGDKVPDVTVYGATPKDEIKTGELFAGKKAVVFGVPGQAERLSSQ